QGTAAPFAVLGFPPYNRIQSSFACSHRGEMAEWLKAHAWKACLGETLTWVRIPLSPPLQCHSLLKTPVTTNRNQVVRDEFRIELLRPSFSFEGLKVAEKLRTGGAKWIHQELFHLLAREH